MAFERPIIFIIGPSGVGKSCVSKGIEETYSFLHIDIDQNHGFETNGLPAEWDKDISIIDFALLAADVCDRLTVKQRDGAVLSFPTIHVFSSQQLETASLVGISTVVLWGTEEHCIESRKARSRINRVRFNVKDQERYRRKNSRSFETYARSEYANFRIEAFRPDGSRWSLEHVLALIMERTAANKKHAPDRQ